MADISEKLRRAARQEDAGPGVCRVLVTEAIEAANEIRKLRAALKSISCMKVTPDAEMDRFTLALAIGLARDALGGDK